MLGINFQSRGGLLIWIRIGQGPTALAVGAGRGCSDIFFFSCLSFLFSLPPPPLSPGDGLTAANDVLGLTNFVLYFPKWCLWWNLGLNFFCSKERFFYFFIIIIISKRGP